MKPPAPSILARVERMKDQLRACTTIAEVDATVRKIAPEVRALEVEDRVGAIHIRNLAAYRRASISRGLG